MSEGINRRHFLGAALAGGAALAAHGTEQPTAADHLVVGVVGTGGRGTSLAAEFAKLAGVYGRIRLRRGPQARRGSGGRGGEGRRQGAAADAGLPQTPRRQGREYPGRRHAEPLARAGGDSWLRRRQARLRREAVQPQSARGRVAGRSGSQV